MTYKQKLAVVVMFFNAINVAALTIDGNDVEAQVFYNTDQQMHNGDVNKINLDAAQNAFENSKPKDSIKTCNYQEDAICKIIIRERMPTIIKLPKYEWVADWILGDDINFEINTINGSTRSISLKGYSPGVDTSLNIIGGSGLIYSFYILNNSIDAKQVSDFIVNLKASDEILERIAQAKRFYKDRPIAYESLEDIIQINIKNNALHTAFKKILPNDWNLNIDKKLQTRERLIDVISEQKSRHEVITDLAANLKLKVIFYNKLRLLVVTTLNEVIE